MNADISDTVGALQDCFGDASFSIKDIEDDLLTNSLHDAAPAESAVMTGVVQHSNEEVLSDLSGSDTGAPPSPLGDGR
eukprot:385546-Karenia_brevis.AAC.1